MSTIFSKIIAGEIPSYKIYEDDKTFAFLDIHPLTPGHTLVVSKTEVDHIWDLPDEDYQAVMATVHKLGKHLRSTLGVERVGVKVMGTDVPHVHVHLIPFNVSAEYNAPENPEQANDTELAAMAIKLAI